MLRLHSSLLYPQGVELLVSRGADIEAQNNDGETPLHIMARRRRLGCVVMLLSVGANVNAQSSDGSTPLHHAAVVSSKYSYRGFHSSSLCSFSWFEEFCLIRHGTKSSSCGPYGVRQLYLANEVWQGRYRALCVGLCGLMRACIS